MCVGQSQQKICIALTQLSVDTSRQSRQAGMEAGMESGMEA